MYYQVNINIEDTNNKKYKGYAVACGGDCTGTVFPTVLIDEAKTYVFPSEDTYFSKSCEVQIIIYEVDNPSKQFISSPDGTINTCWNFENTNCAFQLEQN